MKPLLQSIRVNLPVAFLMSLLACSPHQQPFGHLSSGHPSHPYPLQYNPAELPALDPTRAPHIITVETNVVRIQLADGEMLWGFGERFDTWNQRGQVVETWARDTAQAGRSSSYFAVPFFISSAGYGLFVNCTGKIRFDCGATIPGELRIEVPESGVELIVFYGPPREILSFYTGLVGCPRQPPDWVFAPWLSRNSYLSAHDVDNVIKKMEAHKLKAGVVVLEAWARSLQDFHFEEHRYPDPASWIARLHQNGYRLICWETPSIWTSAATYPIAQTNRFLVHNADGSEYVTDWLENGRKIDFRQPAARAWWTALHQPLVALGVDGFKTDGGERHPDPWFHNLAPFDYQQAVADAFPSNAITFARSANPVCAKHELFWAGDQHSDWKDLRSVVRAGLSAALCGFPIWGHDIGGFVGNPTPQLYIRWMQLGTFSPIMQFHGETPREPYYFGSEATRIAQLYFDIRRQLQPDLITAAREPGVPIWRPLLWDWPDDPHAQQCDDQFLLGNDLLVAPILDESDEREIYLPPGPWQDGWTHATYTGPTNLLYRAPLSIIPVFTRNGRDLQLQSIPRPALQLIGAHRRIWRGQNYEKIFLQTDTHHEVTLQAPPEFEILPGSKQQGPRLAFYVLWPEDIEVGTYPVTVATETIELVKLPSWPQPVRADGYVDLGTQSETTATFGSGPGGPARLFLGSGDGLTVWLNGEKIFDKQVYRTAEPDEDLVNITLRPGDNELRVHVTHGTAAIGSNGFYLRIAH